MITITMAARTTHKQTQVAIKTRCYNLLLVLQYANPAKRPVTFSGDPCLNAPWSQLVLNNEQHTGKHRNARIRQDQRITTTKTGPFFLDQSLLLLLVNIPPPSSIHCIFHPYLAPSFNDHLVIITCNKADIVYLLLPILSHVE